MAKLARPERGQGRIISGVSGAVANGVGLPVTLVRVLFVIFAFTGIGEIVYLVMWLLLPNRRSYAGPR